MIKESRKREKETKNRSHHKAFVESGSTLKEKNKSILSHQGKKSKTHNKLSLKGKMVGSKSVPKIKIKLQKNNTHFQDSDEESLGIDEYFIFENRIFPVINSDQKRTINRYFWTTESYDKQNKDLRDNSTTCTGFLKKPEMKETGVMTQFPGKVTKDSGIQIKILAQTKSQETMTTAVSTVSTVTKTVQSFQEILNELEFLYLPNSKNFEDLTQIEKQHYRDLFLTLANKLSPEKKSAIICSQLEPQLSPRNINQFVAFEVQKRISHQVNCIDIEIQKGIPTNLLCILSYLSNLFCFIEVQYRQQLLRGLNTPYGYYNHERFALLMKGKPLKRTQKILPQSIYSQLQSEFFAQDDSLDETTIEYMHIHNRAIFDHLNDELNLFRPFFSCNGQPYPWFIPGKITFFSIGEDDIELVLQKAKVKILQSASLLCGVHCDPQPPFSKSAVDQSNVLKDVREQRQRKLIFSQIMSLDQSGDIQDERTKLILKISLDIWNSIIDQANEEISDIARGDSFYIPVFDLTTD